MYSILISWKFLDANSYAFTILLKSMVGTLHIRVAPHGLIHSKVGRQKCLWIISVFFFFFPLKISTLLGFNSLLLMLLFWVKSFSLSKQKQKRIFE